MMICGIYKTLLEGKEIFIIRPNHWMLMFILDRNIVLAFLQPLSSGSALPSKAAQNIFSISFLGGHISHLWRLFLPTTSWRLQSFFMWCVCRLLFLCLYSFGSTPDFQFQFRIKWPDRAIVFPMGIDHLLLAHTHVVPCSTAWF